VERVEAEAIYGAGREVVVEVLLRMDAQIQVLTARVARQDERIVQLERRLNPYTARVLESVPRIDRRSAAMAIAGEAPDPRSYPSGCRFHTRCAHARPNCAASPYALADVGPDHQSACIRAEAHKL
jgi:oligopeptide/dipeptide ABC transporter ATP-binding protein